MNINGMARLLSNILDSQIESGRHGQLDRERIRQTLTSGPELTEQEQGLLLLSPLARYDHQQIKMEVREEVQNRLLDQGIATEIFALAASTDDDKVSLKGNGFTVTLYRQADLGVPWVILVQLASVYQQNIHPMTTLRLADSGGLEWLRGRPDSNGEITASWHDPETDLLSRSRRFSLTLEPA